MLNIFKIKINLLLSNSQFINSNTKALLILLKFDSVTFSLRYHKVANVIGHTMKCLESSVKSKKITYIKIVVSSKTQLDEFKELVDQIFNIISKENIDGFVIQPTYGISEPSLDLLLNLYDIVFPHYIDVKVVPQLHKFIGAP